MVDDMWDNRYFSKNQDNEKISGRYVGQWIQPHQRNGTTKVESSETQNEGYDRGGCTW